MPDSKANLFGDAAAKTADASAVPTPAKGLHIERAFSTEGEHPFDSVEWERRTAAIKNHTGEAIFEQKDVEFPKSWSQLASNVVASKYFYGEVSRDRKSTRLNSSHVAISYAVFCLKKKKRQETS